MNLPYSQIAGKSSVPYEKSITPDEPELISNVSELYFTDVDKASFS